MLSNSLTYLALVALSHFCLGVPTGNHDSGYNVFCSDMTVYAPKSNPRLGNLTHNYWTLAARCGDGGTHDYVPINLESCFSNMGGYLSYQPKT